MLGFFIKGERLFLNENICSALFAMYARNLLKPGCQIFYQGYLGVAGALFFFFFLSGEQGKSIKAFIMSLAL